MKSFRDYLIFKEGKEEETKSVKSEITLGKDNEYEPFMIGNGIRNNLGILVKAFLESPEVEFGPKTIDSKEPLQSGEQKGSGLTRNKLKKKTLYLVGGAVRDHLRGETPNDYDLVTDATIEEVRLILQNAGFNEIQPQDEDDDMDKSKYEHLPKNAASSGKVFWVNGVDPSNEEYSVGAKVNGEEFEIVTFHKHPKGSGAKGKKMEFTSRLEDDAAKRDFTINSMYIPLTNDKGPNNKLIDVHGGALDLKASRVNFVGNPKDRLKEDQMRGPRYARFAAEMGATNIPKEIKDAIAEIADLPALQPCIDKKTGKTKDGRGKLKKEFLKGLQKTKMDPKIYVYLYQQLGLLKTVFPGMEIKLDGPDDMTDKKEKHLAIAWLLRKNDPDKVYDMLIDGQWDKEEAKRIRFLIGYLEFNPNMGPEDVAKLANNFSKSGFSSGYLQGKPMGKKSHLSTWADMNRDKFKSNYEHEDFKKATDAFLKHVSYGDMKPDKDDPEFEEGYDYDPIYNTVKENSKLQSIKNQLEHKRFKDILYGRL